MRKEEGFTLVELILGITIIAVFITALTYFSIDVFRAKAKSTAALEVQQNARFVLQRLAYYLRNSEEGIDVGDSQFFPTDPGRLHVKMSPGASDDVIFDVDSNRLRIKIGPAAAVPLTTDEVSVVSLTFKNNSASSTPGNITINMTVEYDNPGGSKEFDYSYDVESSVSLRNP
jgi:prepilin-type N-terminal cleavage/methylation domain-containing protein